MARKQSVLVFLLIMFLYDSETRTASCLADVSYESSSEEALDEELMHVEQDIGTATGKMLNLKKYILRYKAQYLKNN